MNDESQKIKDEIMKLLDESVEKIDESEYEELLGSLIDELQERFDATN